MLVHCSIYRSFNYNIKGIYSPDRDHAFNDANFATPPADMQLGHGSVNIVGRKIPPIHESAVTSTQQYPKMYVSKIIH